MQGGRRLCSFLGNPSRTNPPPTSTPMQPPPPPRRPPSNPSFPAPCASHQCFVRRIGTNFFQGTKLVKLTAAIRPHHPQMEERKEKEPLYRAMCALTSLTWMQSESTNSLQASLEIQPMIIMFTCYFYLTQNCKKKLETANYHHLSTASQNSRKEIHGFQNINLYLKNLQSVCSVAPETEQITFGRYSAIVCASR